MTVTRYFGLWLVVMLSVSGCTTPSNPAESDDIRIVNARVIDGTGAPSFIGEVAIRDGVIAYVGPERAAPEAAKRTIDASGRVVSPGFIDPHSHGNPLETPDFENFLAMGVTTITLGQDGSSPPVDDLAPWLDTVRARGIGPNLAMFVGHGTLRNQSGIGNEPVPDEASMARMMRLLETNLDVTFGLSTGLEYNPGLNAGDAEMLALAGIVGDKDRLIMSHIRNEDDPVLAQSLDELIRQGQFARVHVAHLKSVYGKGASRGKEILAKLESARRQGVTITADVYPYTASYTGLSLLFPVWAKTSAQFETARLERRDELANYLRQRVEGRNGPSATLLGTAPYAGLTLAELAEELGKPFEEVLIDDLGPDGGSAAYFIMDDELQAAIIADPRVAISSDGSPTGYHPRGHGTFARILETFVTARGALTLEEAIRKMTSLPASIMGLSDRGTLSVGDVADLLMFDPANIVETATFESPFSLAAGFDFVLVNGRVARADGVLAPDRYGQVLRPSPASD